MNQQISVFVDKVLTKGMAIMESEKAQQIMSTPQAQKALDFGMVALNKIQALNESCKAVIASKLGLATQKEVDELREIIERLESAKTADKPADAEQKAE